MAFPQPSDYRPPIIPDGEIYTNPSNGRTYYWTQILLPEGSTPDTATSIGGYWTVACDDTSKEGYLLRHGEDVLDCPGPVTYRWNSPTEFRAVLSKTPVNYDTIYSTLTLDKDVLLRSNIDLKLLAESDFYAASAGDFKVIAPRFELRFIDTTQIFSTTSNIEQIRIDDAGPKITKTIDDTTHPQHIIPKKYVDQNIDILQNEIIDLQEEIEAIAPSLDKGIWEFDNERFINGDVTRRPLPGMYLLLKGDFPGWTYTNQYAEADAIVFNKEDYNNKLHENWDLVETDKLIQLYDKPDPDFLLGEINDVLDLGDIDNPYGDEAAVVKFKRTETKGSPTNKDDLDGKYLTYVNIFSAPTGGDASLFVKKTGDTMTGNLTIDKSKDVSADVEVKLELKGSRPSTKDSAATIAFENDQTNTPGYLTYRSFGSDHYFKFNRDVELGNHGLHDVNNIQMRSDAYIGSGTLKRIVIRNATASSAGTEIQRTQNDTRIFAIPGKPSGSGSVSNNFFYAYANAGSDGDAINYSGKISSSSNIVNKGYVDSKMPQYKITKNNGNYYIN